MLNITKLAIWPELQAMGFERVNFRFWGKLNTIGARLGTPKGEILIEPCYGTGEKKYHITGPVKSPKQDTIYQYDSIGRKQEIYILRDRINQFYTAREIRAIIKYMTD